MGVLSTLMASILGGAVQTVWSLKPTPLPHPQLNTQEVFLLLNKVGLNDVGTGASVCCLDQVSRGDKEPPSEGSARVRGVMLIGALEKPCHLFSPDSCHLPCPGSSLAALWLTSFLSGSLFLAVHPLLPLS